MQANAVMIDIASSADKIRPESLSKALNKSNLTHPTCPRDHASYGDLLPAVQLVDHRLGELKEGKARVQQLFASAGVSQLTSLLHPG